MVGIEIRRLIRDLIREAYDGPKRIDEGVSDSSYLIDKILDRINRDGMRSLSFDERQYLSQYNSNSVDRGLEQWLLSDDDSTFDNNREKLPYDEFIEGEDIFGNREKLFRVISKHFGKRPLTGNAEWGGGHAWPLDRDAGTFIYLGDDELIVLERMKDQEGNNRDRVVKYITDASGFYRNLLNHKRANG